ncbi:MAG: DUF937 domain-containing protein [Bacteroidales bacterium]
MLDGILDLVKDQAMKAIGGNTDVPEEKKEDAINTTTSTIVDGLKDQMSSGNLDSIMGLFGGSKSDVTNNPLVSSLQNSVVSALGKKVGLNPSICSSIASAVVPTLIGMISNKEKDPNDSFSIASLVGSFAGQQGGKKGGLLGGLSNLFGK